MSQQQQNPKKYRLFEMYIFVVLIMHATKFSQYAYVFKHGSLLDLVLYHHLYP